ncbi:MAG: hypothetical protein AAFR65_15435 [Pseudomonadota bacterium]
MPKSETLERLNRSVAEQQFTDEQVRVFMQLTVNERLSNLLDRYADKLADLTLDGAVEEIVNLKDADLQKLRSVEGDQRDAKLAQEVAELREHAQYARSFRYLIKTFIERVLEKLGLRARPQ